MKLDTQVYFGDSVKALGEGKVGGYLVRFGGRDLTGDYFTEKTYLGKHEGDGMDCMFHHGIPLKADLAGFSDYLFAPLATKRDQIGIWAETVLNISDDYERKVYELAEAGKLGWSSGAAGHTVRKTADGEIKRWVIAEGSLTPSPAEPRNRTMTIKSLIDKETGDVEQKPDIELPADDETAETPTELINSRHEKDEQPEAQTTGTGDEPVSSAVEATENTSTADERIVDIQVLENKDMTEAQQPPVESSFEAQMKSMGEQLNNITKFLDNMPVSQNPGYVTADGGKADKNIKSFGDYLVAVRRNDTKRLEEIYEVKAMTEDNGSSGGYLIPDEYQSRLLQVAAQNSQIVAQVEEVPVTSPTGKIPALDMFFTPTAGDGQTALAGGLNPAAIAESGAYSSSDAGVELVEWRIGKIGFKTTVSNELMTDSPISMEALLTRLAGIAIGAKTESYVLRGNGVNVPLGILNAPCAVPQSAANTNTFAYADASSMISKHLATSSKVFWLMHKSTIPDVTKFEVGTGGAVWMANVSAGMGSMPLLGYPILFSEHLPKADSSGHVILADLGAYLLFTKGAMTVAYSEHADFANGNVVWRFDRRLDGQPWMKAAVTDANPGGSYITSPFVYFTN